MHLSVGWTAFSMQSPYGQVDVCFERNVSLYTKLSFCNTRHIIDSTSPCLSTLGAVNLVQVDLYCTIQNITVIFIHAQRKADGL